MKETLAPVQSFGSFIKSKRLQLGLTQHDVATMAGINQGYLCRVENGIKEPTLTRALKLCDVLDLNINDFASKYI